MGSNIRYQNILLTHNGSDIAEDFLRFNRVALLLPTILTKFQTDYPDINIQVIEDNSIELQNMLVKGDIDLMLEQLPFADDIAYYTLGEDHLYLLVTDEYLKLFRTGLQSRQEHPDQHRKDPGSGTLQFSSQ